MTRAPPAAASSSSATGPRGRDGLGRPQRAGAGETDIDLPTSPAQGTVLELPDGVLVDVLA